MTVNIVKTFSIILLRHISQNVQIQLCLFALIW